MVREQYSESGSQKKNKKDKFPMRMKAFVENKKIEVSLGHQYVNTFMLSFILSTQNVLDDGNSVFAIRYQMALMLLLEHCPCLCLLLKLNGDNSILSIKAIVLLINHFILAWLNEDALIPPPPDAWKRYRNEDVVVWKNFFLIELILGFNLGCKLVVVQTLLYNRISSSFSVITSYLNMFNMFLSTTSFGSILEFLVSSIIVMCIL
ncbi:hypothetical protein V2J09_006378 [Rumex salicifolius]